ncbi:hypothetical protein [Nostoc sp. CMAA1605]|uniref:hypothetical protein n=1 Tax=Nostoc sp. CMAA1605 TaxID=2055159 RepID=UPI001F255849|nr:hypothetical protein [Nostoc sp. CMAA1605]
MTLGLPTPTVQAKSQTSIKQTKDSIAGVWNSSEGTITVQQSGSRVSATYTQDNGVIEGSISGNVLTGYWSEDSSNRRCNTSRNGRYYWGRIRFVFDNSKFSGLWGYCDDEPSRTWTGNLISKTPVSKPEISNSIAGVWNSSEGTITVQQSGSRVSATYTQDNGVIEGSMSGNVLTGYWNEDSSNRRCNTSRNGRYYWGRIRFVFDNSKFSGLWGYCDDEPSRTWTGNRRNS